MSSSTLPRCILNLFQKRIHTTHTSIILQIYTGIFRKIYSTVFFFKLVMEDKVSIIYKSVYTFKMPKTFLNTGFSIFFLLTDAGIFISLCTFFIYTQYVYLMKWGCTGYKGSCATLVFGLKDHRNLFKFSLLYIYAK